MRTANDITTPIELLKLPKYNGFTKARILKHDRERVPIIDFLLAQLYRSYILLEMGCWIDAFNAIYNIVCVVNYFNEFVIYIRACFLLVLILQKMGQFDQAFQLLACVRDLAEETNNYPEALQVYEHFGKMC